MSDTEKIVDAPEDTDADKGTEQGQRDDVQEATFTQADVDRLVAKVRAEEKRKASERFADYDELKSKAGEVKTAEERLAELEKRYRDAEVKALRSDVATEWKISAEDRDLFLTGEDGETLAAQAKRLTERLSEKPKTAGRVPSQGTGAPDSGVSSYESGLERGRARFQKNNN